MFTPPSLRGTVLMPGTDGGGEWGGAWETLLPAAGNATPSVYDIGGREYVVIVCGGGKNDAPSGSSIVAFALPPEK
jgi:glucose dehydrogenase